MPAVCLEHQEQRQGRQALGKAHQFAESRKVFVTPMCVCRAPSTALERVWHLARS